MSDSAESVAGWWSRRKAAKAAKEAAADEDYNRWRDNEIRLYGHVRSHDEAMGWCTSDRCFRTAPHLPHGADS